MSIQTTAIVVPDLYEDGNWIVRGIQIINQRSHFVTLYEGTEQQCKDWLRTAKHQRKI